MICDCITEEDKNVDYKIYENNNRLICDALIKCIDMGRNIDNTMVFGLSVEMKTIKSINTSCMIACSFSFCEFNDNMCYNVFKNTTFTGCEFYNDIDKTKFINCNFFNCRFKDTNITENSEFTGSLIEKCTFNDCELCCNDNKSLFAAKEIKNPTFSNCILPDYVTDDFIYKTEKIVGERQHRMHASFYFFIKSCKLITINGMIIINDYIKTGVITDSIRDVFRIRNVVSTDITISDDDIHSILRNLIAKREVAVSQLVLEGFNEK